MARFGERGRSWVFSGSGCLPHRPDQPEDYLEWQISYDTDNLHEPSLVKEVILQKESGVRYDCELVRLVLEGRKLSLISSAELKQIKTLLNDASFPGIEESERIGLEPAETSSPSIGEPRGFRRFHLITPVYIKEGSKYSSALRL